MRNKVASVLLLASVLFGFTQTLEIVSRGKTATQSGTFTAVFGTVSYVQNASKAVDGNYNRYPYRGVGCAMVYADDTTYSYSRRAWWKLNLGAQYDVYSVKIYNQKNYEHYPNHDTKVIVNDGGEITWTKATTCGITGSVDKEPIVTVNCTYNGGEFVRGRHVILWRTHEASSHKLDNMVLCEVEVYSCPDFFWGEADCSKPCSTNCKGQGSCDARNGTCLSGCKIGFWGVGSLGCELSCYCKDGAECHVDDGYCVKGCEPGYGGNAENHCDTVLPTLQRENIQVEPITLSWTHQSWARITIKSQANNITVSGYKLQLLAANGELLRTKLMQETEGGAIFQLQKLNACSNYSVTITPMTSSPQGHVVMGETMSGIFFITPAPSSGSSLRHYLWVTLGSFTGVLVICIIVFILIRYPGCGARVTSCVRPLTLSKCVRPIEFHWVAQQASHHRLWGLRAKTAAIAMTCTCSIGKENTHETEPL